MSEEVADLVQEELLRIKRPGMYGPDCNSSEVDGCVGDMVRHHGRRAGGDHQGEGQRLRRDVVEALE